MSLTITKSYNENSILYAADLDNICDSLETYFNVTKIDSEVIQAASLTADKINALAVTDAKLEETIVSASSTSSSLTDLAASFTDVSGSSVTVTTSGRPVLIHVAGSISSWHNSGAYRTVYLKVVRDTTALAYETMFHQNSDLSGNGATLMPLGFFILDPVASGTYTYKLQWSATGASSADLTLGSLVLKVIPQ